MPELPRVQPGRLGHQGGLDLLGEVFAAAQRGLFGLGRDGVDGRADQPGVRRVELTGGQRGADRGEDRGQRFTGQPAPRRQVAGGPDPGGGFAGGDAQQLAEQHRRYWRRRVRRAVALVDLADQLASTAARRRSWVSTSRSRASSSSRG